MRKLAKIRLVGTIAGILPPLLLCGVATSQTVSADNQVINQQVQLGDIWSGQTLQVDSASNGASSTSTAVGNAASAAAYQSSLDVQSSQTAGNVAASSVATVNGSAGPYYAVTTSATGNTSTAGACCAALTGQTDQTVNGAVTAQSTASLGGG